MSIKTETLYWAWEEVFKWCCDHRKELRLIHNTESVGENLTYTEYKSSENSYITVEHWNIVSDGSAQYINKKLVYVRGNYKPCLTVKI